MQINKQCSRQEFWIVVLFSVWVVWSIFIDFHSSASFLAFQALGEALVGHGKEAVVFHAITGTVFMLYSWGVLSRRRLVRWMALLLMSVWFGFTTIAFFLSGTSTTAVGLYFVIWLMSLDTLWCYSKNV